jgi:hypothetical protein
MDVQPSAKGAAMRIYKVSLDADFGDADGRAAWTRRKADIPKLKRELTEATGDCGWPDPEVETIEFEPTVAGILAMLNRHATRG